VSEHGDLLFGLNDAQRQGVLHEGSPLIVLAGPGTGKTRLITHRVAHLILERGVEPSTIVAVTFTNKAAGELRERLAELVGPSAADSVHANTFHGFGLRLLRRFPDLSGIGGSPEIIDSAQRRRLLRALAGERDIYGPLLSLGADALLDEAGKMIELFRHNALSPGECAAFARAWAERLGEGLGSDGSEIDDDSLAAQRQEHARFVAHAELYGLFESACRARGWLTIDELITLPAMLLREHERVRAICHSDYRHFVVDEFQDVNLAQIGLVRALAPPERHPDLVVVGDDDQAIYEFRGADDRAFARFASIWTDSTTLELTENYRSQQPVLEVANAVIARASDRFAPEKRIERAEVLQQEDVAPGAAVEIVQLQRDPQAGDAIAAMVCAEAALEPDGQLSRIAVIARAHSELDSIGEALELEGIPTQRHTQRGVADDEGVQDLLAWVELLVDPKASWAVRRVLGRPPFGVDVQQLAVWEREFMQQRRLVVLGAGAEGTQDKSTSGGSDADSTSFAVKQGDYAGWLAVRAADDTNVGRFADARRELFEQASSETAADMVWTIATRFDLVHADLLGPRDRALRVERLVRVVRFVRAVQHRLDPAGDLGAFWSYYHDLDERDRSFGAIGEEVVGRDEESEGGVANAVQLLSAHGAKGLEFDVVFVPRVNPPNGFPKTSGGQHGPVLPEGLVDRLGDERDAKARSRAEERRIFYVAATRAERRLVLLTKKTKARSKSEHYAQELLYDEPDLIVARELDEVLGTGGGRDALAAEAPAGAVREMQRRAADTERRAARAQAAAALDAVDSADADPEAIARAVEDFRRAAARTAVAAVFDATGETPAWAEGAGAGEAAARLAVSAAEEPTEISGFVFAPMRAPIDLSFTTIDHYTRCPACFYVRHVLGLGEAPTPALSTGGLIHQAMEWYGRAWRDADVEGKSPPGVDELVAYGRRLFVAQLRTGGVGDGLTADELAAMLMRAHEMMVESRAEILEIERRIVLPYVVDGAEHRLVAKLDRVDRIDSGVRIVDYKTGGASKAKLEPRKDDLQLGVYAMAMRHEMPEVGGRAEYWLLRTGERGMIDLDSIDEGKVRSAIDKAVRGMMSGEFPRKPGWSCSGLCRLLVVGADE